MIDCDKITSVGITTAVEAEAENQKAMSKTARQQRRFELSNPATISPRLTAIFAERFPPDVIAEGHLGECGEGRACISGADW